MRTGRENVVHVHEETTKGVAYTTGQETACVWGQDVLPTNRVRPLRNPTSWHFTPGNTFESLCRLNWSSSGITMFIFKLYGECAQGVHRGMLLFWWNVQCLHSPVLGGQMWCGWEEGGLSEKKSPAKEEKADDAGRSRRPFPEEFETRVQDENLPAANFLRPLWPNVGWAVPTGKKLESLVWHYLSGTSVFIQRLWSQRPRQVCKGEFENSFPCWNPFQDLSAKCGEQTQVAGHCGHSGQLEEPEPFSAPAPVQGKAGRTKLEAFRLKTVPVQRKAGGIKLDDFKLKTVLGRGGFGKVRVFFRNVKILEDGLKQIMKLSFLFIFPLEI